MRYQTRESWTFEQCLDVVERELDHEEALSWEQELVRKYKEQVLHILEQEAAKPCSGLQLRLIRKAMRVLDSLPVSRNTEHLLLYILEQSGNQR